jgi:uncharacterized membrane protein YphA (DoxX/SURF4 family)
MNKLSAGVEQFMNSPFFGVPFKEYLPILIKIGFGLGLVVGFFILLKLFNVL